MLVGQIGIEELDVVGIAVLRQGQLAGYRRCGAATELDHDARFGLDDVDLTAHTAGSFSRT